MTGTPDGSTGAKGPAEVKQPGRGPFHLPPPIGRRGLITALLVAIWLVAVLVLFHDQGKPAGTSTGPTYQRQFPDRAAGDKYLVGAFYYPWYGPGRYKWQDGYVQKPALGEYDSADPKVIDRQIDLATGHGVDFFLVSWWGPGSAPDQTLQTAFLKSPLIGDIKFAINYESDGRLVAHNGQIDLNDPRNRRILASDFAYLAKTYWNNPHYLKIDGADVVFLYASKSYIGDVAVEAQALRAQASKDGDRVYLIGDEVNWGGPSQVNPARLKAFDAISSYNMYTTNLSLHQNFTARVGAVYSRWEQEAKSLGVTFIPDATPGFNDTHVRPDAHHPPLPPSAARFQRQMSMALAHVEPPLDMLLITSWNEWNEDTAIEPSKESGLQDLKTLQNALAGIPAPTRSPGEVGL